MNYVVDINPVALDLGFFALRWYSLAYIAGFLFGYIAFPRLLAQSPGHCPRAIAEKHFTTAAILLIVGGRLGEIVFYNLGYYLSNPIKVFYVWEGGMSFHGGFLGVVAAMIWISWRERVPFLWITDCVCPFIPFGLMTGRLANFVNGELWGKPTDVWWAMIFPRADSLPRHPSQLYEAALEGLALLTLLMMLSLWPWARQRLGLRTGVFTLGYGIARFTVEFFREPDGIVEAFGLSLSTGQMLSVPMIVVGGGMIIFALSRRAVLITPPNSVTP